MPRTRSLALAELKIGILSVVSIAIACVVIFMLSGTGGFFWQRYWLKARFTDVAGLKAGAPVRIAGVEVGTVRGVDFVGDQVEVSFELSRRMRPRVTTRSLASLGSLSLLGQTTVDITAASLGEPLPEWGYVRTGASPGQLSDVATSASQGLQEVSYLLREMREGKGTLGRLFQDESLYREVDEFVSAATHVARALQQGRGTAGRLVNDASVYRALDASLGRLNDMLQRVSAGQGSLGRLLNDDGLATSLTSASGRIDDLAGKLQRGEGTAGKLLNETVLYDRLAATAGRLEQLTTTLGEGQGTAGQLLQDRRLYENMNGAASELRGLIAEIKKNPKKYLNVKVSVF